MKKTIIPLLLVGAIITYYGCRKESRNEKNILTDERDLIAILAITDLAQADVQLREMAKGFAWWGYHNKSKRNSIHEFISFDNSFRKANGILWGHYISNSPFYDLEDEINDACINQVQSNIYLRAFFEAFDLEGCNWWNEIYIPDLDDQDTSLLHVVMPEYNNDVDLDTVMGYYYNVNTSAIDSLLISEDNKDSFYLWIIASDNDCTNLITQGNEGCDNDGFCEPWIGEFYPDCPDCPQPTVNELDLYLWEIQPKSDWKNNGNWPSIRYQESWFSGDYEIDFQYMTIGANNSVKSKRVFLWNPASVGANGLPKKLFLTDGEEVKHWKYPDERLLASIEATGRHRGVEKCRKKKPFGGTKCKGSNDLIMTKMLLTRNFITNQDAIIYLLQELDRNGKTRETTAPFYRGSLRSFGLLHSKKRKPYTTESQQTDIVNLVGKVNVIESIAQPNSTVVTQWTQFPTPLVNPLTGLAQTAYYVDDDTDDEFRLRFVYFYK